MRRRDRSRLFADLVQSGQRLGVTHAAAREVTGLPVGIPVAAGAMDHPCGAFAVGIREPGDAIIDSQSSKTTEAGRARGDDAGKKVNGRKRHIVVDTLGHLLEVVVHVASVQNRDGAKLVLAKLSTDTRKHMRLLWADGGYRGTLLTWVRQHLQATLDIVKPDPATKGFAVLPRRWVVERTFAWFGRLRRLSKDFERDLACSEAVIYLASLKTLPRRCAI